MYVNEDICSYSRHLWLKTICEPFFNGLWAYLIYTVVTQHMESSWFNEMGASVDLLRVHDCQTEAGTKVSYLI